eukprot:SAG31_NODE_12531_length_934_cov_1.445509_1_plen_107_part_00
MLFSLVVAAVVLLRALPPAQATAQRCPAPAADVVDAARQLCSSSPTAESLRRVGVLPERNEAFPVAARVLQDHGFRTAIDLQLLQPEGEEATEVIGQLRIAGGKGC